MTPRFLADECFSGALVSGLKDAGHDLVRVVDVAPGATDETVLGIAFRDQRILLTEDNDFGDLVVRLGLPSRGVVRVALRSLQRSDQAVRIISAIAQLGDKMYNAIVTIEPRRTRIRPL